MISKIHIFLSFVILFLIAATAADAQSLMMTDGSYSLKSGETVELTDLYFVLNCRSQLVSPPEATVLDGPPGVTVIATEAMVVPRIQQCSKPVSGAKLKFKADKIDDPSDTIMTIRIKYKTKDGERTKSMRLNLSLFP